MVSETGDSRSIFVQANLLPNLGQFGQSIGTVCIPRELDSCLPFWEYCIYLLFYLSANARVQFSGFTSNTSRGFVSIHFSVSFLFFSFFFWLSFYLLFLLDMFYFLFDFVNCFIYFRSVCGCLSLKYLCYSVCETARGLLSNYFLLKQH